MVYKIGLRLLALGLLILIIAALLVQQRYASVKAAQFSRCADFSEMTPVSTDSARNSLVMLGDSRLFEWPPGQLDVMYDVHNWGISGVTVPEVLCGVQKQAGWQGADLYIIQVGINDLTTANAMHRLSMNNRRQREQASLEAMHALIAKVAEAEKRVIILDVVPPIRLDMARRLVWGSGVAASVQRFNAQLDASLFPKNVKHIKISPLFYDDTLQEWRQDYARDALHWSAVAYHAIERKLFAE